MMEVYYYRILARLRKLSEAEAGQFREVTIFSLADISAESIQLNWEYFPKTQVRTDAAGEKIFVAEWLWRKKFKSG